MKKLFNVLTLSLGTIFCIYAQEGKVGINTDNPQSTLDIDGDIRVRNMKFSAGGKADYLLTIDEDGSFRKVKSSNFGAPGVVRVSALGLNIKNRQYGKKDISLRIKYSNIERNGDIDYDNNGTFTVNTPGYYLVNVQNNVDTPQDSSEMNDGTLDTNVYNGKTKIGGTRTWHKSGTYGINHNVMVTSYLKKGDKISVWTGYTRDYEISTGNISFMYLSANSDSK